LLRVNSDISVKACYVQRASGDNEIGSRGDG
jgi:hypothetical protein